MFCFFCADGTCSQGVLSCAPLAAASLRRRTVSSPDRTTASTRLRVACWFRSCASLGIPVPFAVFVLCSKPWKRSLDASRGPHWCTSCCLCRSCWPLDSPENSSSLVSTWPSRSQVSLLSSGNFPEIFSAIRRCSALLHTILPDRGDTRYFLTPTSSLPCVIDWQCAKWHWPANQRPTNDTLDKWVSLALPYVKWIDRRRANVTGPWHGRQNGRVRSFWFGDLIKRLTNQRLLHSRQLVQLRLNHCARRKWAVIWSRIKISWLRAGARGWRQKSPVLRRTWPIFWH